ncbi:MAG: collagenase [Psychrobium sp.]|nr:collagenase [Psychrobium sp.]
MKKKLLLTLLSIGLLAGCQTTTPTPVPVDYSQIKLAKGNIVHDGEVYIPAWVRNEKKINQVLSNVHYCADNIVLRFQTMSTQDITDSCKLLKDTETRFHQLFNRQGKPVLHDNNNILRANIYAGRDDYVKYVTEHFDVPSDNGGMYLEGLPHIENNSAEYVAYLRNGKVWNLNHEFVHYLDGRFNTYGDYCSPPHDNHYGPEYCPEPAPEPPYMIWWGEGLGEYVAHMKDNPAALKLAANKTFQLSELFYNNSANWNTKRIYRWGYLAVRYMMENQRDKVEDMLSHVRRGDYARYQKVVKIWGTSMDADFHQWLDTVAIK